ncbi:unnamed protein product [Effrenium voratum]|nr:unnamed protein product [Effrenium voratum]
MAPSIKEQREQLQRAIAVCLEQTRRVQQDIAAAAAEEELAQRQLDRAKEDFQGRICRIAAPSSCESQALEDELHGLRCRTEELERRLSFGLFRRWRRRLDQELYAGGCVERTNDVGRLSKDQGFAAAEDLARRKGLGRQLKGQREQLALKLTEAQRGLLRLRSEARAMQQETNDLCCQLAEERRKTNEWWDWHMTRLPQYHDDLQKLRQVEAHFNTVQRQTQECQQQLQSTCSEEEAAQHDLLKSREEFQASEMQVEQVFGLLQEHEAQKAHLYKQSLLDPFKVDRIRRAQHSAERLQEAQDLRRSLEVASEEA